MTNCDWCGQHIKTPIQQPVRLATKRSPVTSEPIGMDVTLTAVSQDRPAILHQNCHDMVGGALLGFLMGVTAERANQQPVV